MVIQFSARIGFVYRNNMQCTILTRKAAARRRVAVVVLHTPGRSDGCAWNNAPVNEMIVIYERVNFRIFPIGALIR